MPTSFSVILCFLGFKYHGLYLETSDTRAIILIEED